MKTTTYTNTLFLNRNACDNEVLQVRDKANRELDAHLENFRALLAFGDYKACNDYICLITNTLSYHSASLTLTADRTGHYPSNYNRVEWLFRHLTRTYNMAFSSLIPTYTVKKVEGRCQETTQQLPLIINPSKVRPLLKSLVGVEDKESEEVSESKGTYFYPLNFVLASNNHHAHLAHLLDNTKKQSLTIDTVIDVTPLYDYITYSKGGFCALETGELIYPISDDYEAAVGVFYELGRLLKAYPDFYRDVLPSPVAKHLGLAAEEEEELVIDIDLLEEGGDFMVRGYDYEAVIGKTFNRLTLLSMGEGTGHDRLGEFRCSCGVTKWIRAGRVISGEIKSCGCLKKEMKSDNYMYMNTKAAKEKAARTSNKATRALKTNKSTGIRNIYYNAKKDQYRVVIERKGRTYRKYAASLEEAKEKKVELIKQIKEELGITIAM